MDADKDILGIGVGSDPFEGSDAVNMFIPSKDFVTAFHGEEAASVLVPPVAMVSIVFELTTLFSSASPPSR